MTDEHKDTASWEANWMRRYCGLLLRQWKTHVAPWRKESDYDCGTWYWVEQFEPRSLDDLADLVSICRALPAHYVVRGKLSTLGARLVASGRTIRRCHTTETIPVPHIEDAPCQSLMVDVDKYIVPAGRRIGSEALVRHIMIQH